MQGCVVHRPPWKHWPGHLNLRRLFVESCAWSWWVLLQAGFNKPRDWAETSQAVYWCPESYSAAYPAYAWDQKKCKLAGASKTSKMCFILAASLTSAMLSFLQQQQQGSHAGLPLFRALFFPGQEQSGPQPWLQVLPVLMKWSETTFPEWISPHSLTLSCVDGTHLSGRSFIVQCRDVPSKTQRVNAV